MKKQFYPFLFLILTPFLFSLASCESDDDFWKGINGKWKVTEIVSIDTDESFPSRGRVRIFKEDDDVKFELRAFDDEDDADPGVDFDGVIRGKNVYGSGTDPFGELRFEDKKLILSTLSTSKNYRYLMERE